MALLHRELHREPPPGGAERLKAADRALRDAKATKKKAEKELKEAAKSRRLRRTSPEWKALHAALVGQAEERFVQAEGRRREEAAAGGAPDATTALGPTLKVAPAAFGDFARQAALEATPEGRRTADLAAAFGCEAVTDRGGVLQPTRMSKQNGNSGKNMLLDVGILMGSVTEARLHAALLARWDHADEGRTLGWDPEEVRPFAHQAEDPGTGTTATMHGANLLAYEGLALLPAVPAGRGLATTGTSRVGDKECFTWPIWTPAVGVEVAGSLLAHPELQRERPDRDLLRRMGVEEVYRSEHFLSDKSPRFRPARPA